MRSGFAAAAAVGVMAIIALSQPVSPARAANIMDEWGSVKTPQPPTLKPVVVDPKTTALLMLDFVTHDPYCGPGKPRCGASLPAMKKLLTDARAHGAAVIYSVAGKYGPSDIASDVAPASNEPTVKAKADKFLGTDLEKILKDKGIQTVIVTGTAANGAVLYTGSGAALRGLRVVVPVDGMSGNAPFDELLTVWQLANGPGFGHQVTVTRSDMIKF